MLKTLRPSAVRPPSANKNACISKTTVNANVAAQGPTKTAASSLFTNEAWSATACKKKVAKEKYIHVGKMVACNNDFPGLWNVLTSTPIFLGDRI